MAGDGSGLVERLRAIAPHQHVGVPFLVHKAADEIESLQARVAELKA